MMGRILWTLIGLVLATAVLHLVLIQPNHPDAMTWQALWLFPLELPVLILLLVALPARSLWTRVLRVVITLLLVLVSILKIADFALFTAFNRAFNPLTDVYLLDAGVRLLAGSIGVVPTTLVVIAAVIAPFIALALVYWATGRWSRLDPPGGLRAVAAILVIPATALAVAEVGQARRAWSLPFDPPGAAFTARVALERSTTYAALMAELEAFRRAAAEDPYAGAPNLLAALDGADILVLFVESYARTSFDNPLYAPTHLPTLEREQARVAEAGLASRSGWLTSPISGGQSWLAHGTFASGLLTRNQALYTAMLASGRKSLFHLAADNGYRAATVAPAVQLPWPEANLLGFTDVYDAFELGYEGEPFNWVTMPDQFTLEAFDRLYRDAVDPWIVEIALISSHAPWVPIPEMVPWEDLGDGTIFNEVATSGDTPAVVWRDQDRVRDQYRLAIDYSLQAVFDYIVRRADEDRITIILGDHPPAMFVSQIESFDVPIHIVGPPDLIARLDAWNWTDGLLPDGTTPVWMMQDFRNRFVSAFSPDAPLAP